MESRAAVLSKSIPYKYVVWRHKKKEYEFEFIYKTDNDKMTNRCLFVNSNLLKQEGKHGSGIFFSVYTVYKIYMSVHKYVLIATSGHTSQYLVLLLL